jgi:hypothetical protein
MSAIAAAPVTGLADGNESKLASVGRFIGTAREPRKCAVVSNYAGSPLPTDDTLLPESHLTMRDKLLRRCDTVARRSQILVA